MWQRENWKMEKFYWAQEARTKVDFGWKLLRYHQVLVILQKKERISAKILVVDFLLTLLFLFFSHRKIKYRQYVKFPCHGPMQVDVIGSEMKLQSVTVSNRFLLRFFIPLHENWKNFPAKCWMVSRIEKEMDGLLSI